jgi:glycine/D-amino acid oxidase-like deaminating enzyme/nitrite reductase/ring-hydroxylating ferredoxin subunit
MAVPVPLNRPLWLEGADTRYPPLAEELEVDVAVVGAGITGLTAAYLLKQAGRSVAVLEQSRVGFGATGYTTAKLTVGHNLIYRDLVEAHGEEAARLYARSNQEAIERVAALVGEHSIDCDFERTANYVYVESPSAAGDLEREVEAAQAAGVDAVLTTDTDLPYPVAAAVRVDDQAQFHPWKYLAALARLVDGDGSRVFESTRALDVATAERCAVEAREGRVRAGHVVVATQLPFLDRGFFFAKAHPPKSYAVAATVDERQAPRGMYISADQPTRSVRSTPGGDGRRVLVVGGESHKPGAEPDTEARYAQLERFLSERFGVDASEYRWSTHDYVPVDRLPYIGRLRRGEERVLVATGFAKWGMTKGTLAAGMLADAILGRPNPYADLYDAKRLRPVRSASRFAKENGEVGLRFVADRVRPRDGRDEIERLEPGGGTVARVGPRLYAVHRDDAGELHVLSARCTHLGCIVGWNDADRAWECPCHGSRFAGDGTVVQGPATADLPRRRLPD